MREEFRNKTILLFDGYCNLCSSAVQFVIKHEKRPDIFFTSLQSDIGRELLHHFNIDVLKTDSLVLIKDNKAYVKSSAALRLTKHLKGLYPLAMLFLIIPAFIRNVVYDFIAKHRYKWFGKSEICMIPDKNISNRFL